MLSVFRSNLINHLLSLLCSHLIISQYKSKSIILLICSVKVCLFSSFSFTFDVIPSFFDQIVIFHSQLQS